MSDSEAEVDVIIGDGRLQLEARPDTVYDAIFVDAFTSDAIPVHLLTLEAFRTYSHAVGPDGKIIVHITNRPLDLEPVVARIADELDFSSRIRRYTRDPNDRFSVSTVWVILEKGDPLALPEEWIPLRTGEVLWTDDYSNVLSVIDWK